MLIKDIIHKFDKSNIKAGDGLEKGKYPLYTCSPIVNKYLDRYLCEDEALVLSTGGNFSIHYVNGKFNYSTDCYVFNTDKYNLKYLYYYLISKTEDINKMFRGAGLKHLNKNEFVLLNVEDINLQEQEKLVENLDHIGELIEIKKKQIEKCDVLVKSQFVEMFEGKKFDNKLLSEICNISSSKRIYANEYQQDGIPFYRSKEIRELGEGLSPSVELFISNDKYKEVKSKYGVPSKNDILVAAIGATIGFMWIVDDRAFYYKDGNLILVHPKVDLSSYYLYYYLKGMIQKYKVNNSSGSAQLALTIEKMEKFNIVLPPIELQNKFAEFVKQIDKQKFEFEKQLKKLEELQASLMQEYFG